MTEDIEYTVTMTRKRNDDNSESLILAFDPPVKGKLAHDLVRQVIEGLTGDNDDDDEGEAECLNG
jgi:hypothetical protein